MRMLSKMTTKVIVLPFLRIGELIQAKAVLLLVLRINHYPPTGLIACKISNSISLFMTNFSTVSNSSRFAMLSASTLC